MNSPLAGFPPELTPKEFHVLSRYIHENFGIILSTDKKLLLETKLRKRLAARGIKSFKEYINFVLSKNNDNELLYMVDEVSTNKTSFFRENAHFDFMAKEILPNFLKRNLSNTMKIWSCGCSSGEEVYSTGITIEEFNASDNQLPAIDYSLLGTDVSTQMLRKATDAVYSEEDVKYIPLHIQQKYFLKSKDSSKAIVRVKPNLRARTQFRRLNLMDASYSLGNVFDIVFCRNVLIYFDRPTQEKVIKKIATNLKSKGYLFLGHSESLLDRNRQLEQVGAFIYQKV